MAKRGNNVYALDTLPAGVITADGNDLKENPTLADKIRWSGAAMGYETPPNIGARVHIGDNALGCGVVKGYFIEDNWLGLYVKLERPPEWFAQREPELFKRDPEIFKLDCAMVFGAELKAVTILH